MNYIYSIIDLVQELMALIMFSLAETLYIHRLLTLT